jgi:nucleotide-binding universal stress UspA family protein
VGTSALAAVHTLGRALSGKRNGVAYPWRLRPSPSKLEAVTSSRLAHDHGFVPVRRLNGTIVCVVDDLEAADAALQVARELADRFDARILLVSIAHGADAAGTAGDHADEEQRIGGGHPAEAVARIAMDEAADLIVVGARRGLRAGTFRSPLADDLAVAAACPVVVAPPRAQSPVGPT